MIILNEARGERIAGAIIAAEDTLFYLGDPGYVMDDRWYRGVWGDTYGFKDGVYEIPRDEYGLGGRFIVANTAYGDGQYAGRLREYPVDAGIIALVEHGLWKEGGLSAAKKMGAVYKLRRGQRIAYEFKDGVFMVDTPLEHERIDTRDEPDSGENSEDEA